MTQTIIGSLARLANFEDGKYQVKAVQQATWETGDFVLGEVTGTHSELYHIEDCVGTMIPVMPGDFVIGALGSRAATLEGVGSWTDVRQGKMHALTSAGLFGAFTSLSKYLPRPLSLNYSGHIMRRGERTRMTDVALTSGGETFAVPTILLVGTSMSAGKTLTGDLVCSVLASAGRNVIGAKLTGAGRYRDIVSFKSAGAFEVYDFVDAGLPSTVVPEDEFRAAIRPLLSIIHSRHPEFLIAESGASPLEPYNGAAAIDELGDNICCTILCASDPYAVVGVQKAFGLEPDLVTGPATNTSAAIDLVTKLTGIEALNILEDGSERAMREFLEATLKVSLS